MTLLLVTCSALPTGEPGAPALDSALAKRGIDFQWVSWDDPTVRWEEATLIAVRSPWDYVSRWQEFLDWARAVESVAPMLNSAEIFAWNLDKAYLADLGDLPVIPTTALSGVEDVRVMQAAYGQLVLKPRVGAGGVGLRVVGAADPLTALREEELVGCVVQPLVSSVRDVGETSVYVLDGRVVSAFNKLPDLATDEVRVNEEYGGVVREVPVADELAELALAAAAEVPASAASAGRERRGPDYCRVDVLRFQDAWCVSEIEVTEPGLYLDVSDVNAQPFADLVRRRLATGGRSAG